MKKITTLIFFALSVLTINAQSLLPIKYGLKIGANISNINSISNDGVKNIESSELIGIAGGFYMEIPINDKWYINPELIYCQKGANFTYSYVHDYAINERDLHISSHELKLAYIELNPTVSYKSSSGISLNIGPSVSYLITPEYNILSDKGEDDGEVLHEELADSEYTEETLDVGLNLGVSYYLTENFLIDGKVNTGFMSIGDITKEVYTGSNGNEARENIYTIRNNGLIFSIVYLF